MCTMQTVHPDQLRKGKLLNKSSEQRIREREMEMNELPLKSWPNCGIASGDWKIMWRLGKENKRNVTTGIQTNIKDSNDS